MRLIDADMLIAFLKKLGRLLKVEENHKRECRLIGNIINYIEKRAAINPADLVPKGRWIWDERFHDYACSECHNWDLKTPNYCSNCGADMREKV